MASQAEVCIHSRSGPRLVGATTMDRPEWVAAHTMKPEVYCCLTNNKNRGKKPNAGGDETPVGGPNPRAGNLYGQIVRWRPDGGDHLATGFDWDLYVVAGNPTVHSDANAGSSNVNADNMFNSPDGLAFDSMAGSGSRRTETTRTRTSSRGRQQPDAGGGPGDGRDSPPHGGGRSQCEVTGFAWSADRKTVFVGIQHPGERGDSHFRTAGTPRPVRQSSPSPATTGAASAEPLNDRNRKGGAPAPPFRPGVLPGRSDVRGVVRHQEYMSGGYHVRAPTSGSSSQISKCGHGNP